MEAQHLELAIQDLQNEPDSGFTDIDVDYLLTNYKSSSSKLEIFLIFGDFGSY